MLSRSDFSSCRPEINIATWKNDAWRLHSAPDPFKRDLPASELLDRCDTGKRVPDLNQPLQGPGTWDCFPFFPSGDYGFLSIPSLSIVRRDVRSCYRP